MEYKEDSAVYIFLLLSFGRQLYSLGLAYLIFLMVSPSIEKASIFRPARFIRAVLSMDIWLPLASLSYSMYLWHIPVLIAIFKTSSFVNPEFIDDKNPVPT